MALGGAVIRRNTDEAMDAAFGLCIAIGIFAFDQHCRRLDARLITGLIIHHFDFIAALFGPAIIHAL